MKTTARKSHVCQYDPNCRGLLGDMRRKGTRIVVAYYEPATGYEYRRTYWRGVGVQQAELFAQVPDTIEVNKE